MRSTPPPSRRPRLSSTTSARRPALGAWRCGLHVAPGFVEGTEFGARFFDYAQAESVPLYAPGENLSPADVAEVVAYVLATPPHVDVNQVLVRPTAQPD